MMIQLDTLITYQHAERQRRGAPINEFLDRLLELLRPLRDALEYDVKD
jgi:hypothetical protein